MMESNQIVKPFCRVCQSQKRDWYFNYANALCKKLLDRPSMENRKPSFSCLRLSFSESLVLSHSTLSSRIVTVLLELSDFILPVVLPQRPIC